MDKPIGPLEAAYLESQHPHAITQLAEIWRHLDQMNAARSDHVGEVNEKIELTARERFHRDAAKPDTSPPAMSETAGEADAEAKLKSPLPDPDAVPVRRDDLEAIADILAKAPHLDGNRLNYDTRQVQALHYACATAHNRLKAALESK